MTVSELIEALKAYPSDMTCVLGGFDEYGYCLNGGLSIHRIVPDDKGNLIEGENGAPALFLGSG